MTSPYVSSTLARMRPDVDLGPGRLYLRLWPIAILEVGDCTRDTYAALLAAVEEKVLLRGEPHVVVTDTRPLRQIPGAEVRKLMSDWMKRNSVHRSSLGAVTIASSSVVRGALTALYWVYEPPTPQGVAADWSDAHRWALARLDAARVPVRPSLRDATIQPY